ncbi:MAG: hypothetical protein LLF76_14175, partial [Planctomycetaceae bacterium]|nr:hypothetical protein [Planctomycetaceae bacterium]
QKNFVLLQAGHAYFSRFFRTSEGELLANYHAVHLDNAPPHFTPIKAVNIDEQGTLRWRWRQANDALKAEPVAVGLSAAKGPVRMLEPVFNTTRGVLVEGEFIRPSTIDQRVGLYVECGTENGIGIQVVGKRKVEFGPMKADAGSITVQRSADRDANFGEVYRFRLLVKDTLCEFYLNDEFIECFSLPGKTTGRIGILDDYDVYHLRAWYPR